MKTFYLFLLLLCCQCAMAQTDRQLSTDIARLEAAGQEAAALDKLRQVLQSNPQHYYALWKTSELYSRLGAMQKTKSAQIAYYTNGKQYAEKAIRVNPNNADGYYALSVAMGRMALAGPNKEKIAAVKAIKSNAEKALRLNPIHGRAWHVLGKWHYEVSGLNFVERTAVKVFYGGFPQASIEESIRAYEKAQALEPYFALNYLELAKAYIRNDQEGKAKGALQKLAALPNKTGDDVNVKAEGRKLMQSLD